MIECETCEGYGRIWDSSCPISCGDIDHTAICPECGGAGEIMIITMPLGTPRNLIGRKIENVELPEAL